MASKRTHTLFSDARLTVRVVETLETSVRRARGSCQLFGRVAPIAVLIDTPDGTLALDMEGRPTEAEGVPGEDAP